MFEQEVESGINLNLRCHICILKLSHTDLGKTIYRNDIRSCGKVNQGPPLILHSDRYHKYFVIKIVLKMLWTFKVKKR